MLLLPEQRVWGGGGRRGGRPRHWLPGPRSDQWSTRFEPASADRRDILTYLNGMEMTQTRGHADRFLSDGMDLGQFSVSVKAFSLFGHPDDGVLSA